MTSVVMSQEEYDEFLLAIAAVDFVKADEVAHLARQKHIKLMMRGTKTQHLFDHVSVETKYMSIIVRGEGLAVARRLSN